MDRGYGFIKTEEGKDVFFHRNDIEGLEFDTLREGQEVEFDTGKGRDGRPKATRVRLAVTQAGDDDGDGGDGGG